jgi:hypothetical protein
LHGLLKHHKNPPDFPYLELALSYNRCMQDEKALDRGSDGTPLEMTAVSGCRVQLVLYYEDGETEILSLEIVPDEVADFKNGLLGESTPLAQSVNGHSAGDTIPYRAGDIVKVYLESVLPGSQGSHKDVIERRQAIVREAVRQSDLTNAIIFASAVNNKWGDYDPGAMAEELDKKP